MARAIEPSHTEGDSDALFAVTINEVANPQVNEIVLSWTASDVAWNAVLSRFEKQADSRLHRGRE